VTSRAGEDELDDVSDEETRSADVVATPKQTTPRSAARSAFAKKAAPNGNGSDRTAHDAVATSDAPDAEDAISSAEPAQAAGSANGHSDGADAADDPFLAEDNSPVFSFGLPETAPVSFGPDELTAREPETPAADSPSPSALGLPSAEPSSVSPASFAWDMPDPPPDSPSSPARTFLRTDASAKSPTAKSPTVQSPSAPRTPAATVSAKKNTRDESQSGPQGMPRIGSSKRSARQAHLTVARVEPWSVMKFSFVVSLVAFVILFVAVAVLYGALAEFGVFDSLQRLVSSLTSSQGSAGVNAEKWFSASRILGYTALLGSLNIVLITAMSTIGAVVYNLTSRLVGGVEVTLRETE
jgi:hypothetical protein